MYVRRKLRCRLEENICSITILTYLDVPPEYSDSPFPFKAGDNITLDNPPA